MPTPISNISTNPLSGLVSSNINLNPLAPKTTTTAPAPTTASTQPTTLSWPSYSSSVTPPLSMSTQSSTPQTTLGPTSGLAPTTPVKSISTDGSGGTTYTFHPPTSSTSSGSSGSQTYTTPSGAQVNAQGGLIQPPPPQTSGQQVTANNQVTFPGLVSSLASNALAGSPVAGTAASGLIANSQNNPLTSGNAYNNYAQAVENLRNLQSGIAQEYGNIEQQPIPLEFQQGREQVLARQYASQLDAAQQAVNQNQAALGYGIQEQQAQQNALTSAGNLGNTGQSLLQSGLNSAAGFAQPNVGAAFYGNPLTGGTFGSSNYGSGAAAAGNAAYAQQGQAQVDTMKGVQAQAQNLEAQLTGLINSGGFNPTDTNLTNSIIQVLKGQVGDPKYQTANNLITDLVTTYAQILGATGDPTNDKLALSQSLINALASGQNITQVVQNLDDQANAKINGLQSNVNSINGGGGTAPSGGSSGTPMFGSFF